LYGEDIKNYQYGFDSAEDNIALANQLRGIYTDYTGSERQEKLDALRDAQYQRYLMNPERLAAMDQDIAYNEGIQSNVDRDFGPGVDNARADVNNFRYQMRWDPLLWQDKKLPPKNINYNSLNSQIHTTLGTLGMVPVFGEPFNLLDAGLYHLEGDNFNRNLSLGSMIPFLGNATGGAQLARKGFQYGKNFFRRGASAAPTIARGATNIPSPQFRGVNRQLFQSDIDYGKSLGLDINNVDDLMKNYNLRNRTYRAIDVNPNTFNDPGFRQAATNVGVDVEDVDALTTYMGSSVPYKRIGNVYTEGLLKNTGDSKSFMFTSPNKDFTTNYIRNADNPYVFRYPIFNDDVTNLTNTDILNRIRYGTRDNFSNVGQFGQELPYEFLLRNPDAAKSLGKGQIVSMPPSGNKPFVQTNTIQFVGNRGDAIIDPSKVEFMSPSNPAFVDFQQGGTARRHQDAEPLTLEQRAEAMGENPEYARNVQKMLDEGATIQELAARRVGTVSGLSKLFPDAEMGTAPERSSSRSTSSSSSRGGGSDVESRAAEFNMSPEKFVGYYNRGARMINEGKSIDDLVKMGYGTRGALSRMFPTAPTETVKVEETPEKSSNLDNLSQEEINALWVQMGNDIKDAPKAKNPEGTRIMKDFQPIGFLDYTPPPPTVNEDLDILNSAASFSSQSLDEISTPDIFKEKKEVQPPGSGTVLPGRRNIFTGEYVRPAEGKDIFEATGEFFNRNIVEPIEGFVDKNIIQPFEEKFIEPIQEEIEFAQGTFSPEVQKDLAALESSENQQKIAMEILLNPDLTIQDALRDSGFTHAAQAMDDVEYIEENYGDWYDWYLDQGTTAKALKNIGEFVSGQDLDVPQEAQEGISAGREFSRMKDFTGIEFLSDPWVADNYGDQIFESVMGYKPEEGEYEEALPMIQDLIEIQQLMAEQGFDISEIFQQGGKIKLDLEKKLGVDIDKLDPLPIGTSYKSRRFFQENPLAAIAYGKNPFRKAGSPPR